MNDNKEVSRLNLDRVSYSYGNVPVIRDMTLNIRQGEVAVLVGPSGCGKSTILNLMSGHLRPAAGTVEKNGIIRMVYQQDGLFPWLTVEENISIGLRGIAEKTARQNELEELLKLINLADFRSHYPHQLSGGMRQRVELARALSGESDILLMDEPFSALDYQTRLRMRRELVRLLEQRPRTVMFVTHDIEEAAQLADRLFVLSARPATVCKELPIDAPKPRELGEEVVISAMKEVFRELGLDH